MSHPILRTCESLRYTATGTFANVIKVENLTGESLLDYPKWVQYNHMDP